MYLISSKMFTPYTTMQYCTLYLGRWPETEALLHSRQEALGNEVQLEKSGGNGRRKWGQSETAIKHKRGLVHR